MKVEEIYDIDEIKRQLKVGDTTQIAEVVGCHEKFVYFILNGKRNADTTTGKKVIKAAKALLISRAEYVEDMKTSL